MNSNKPVELSEKIDYLSQKISLVHSEIRRNDDLELRLNFEEFIDTCIREIGAIRESSNPVKSKVEVKEKESDNSKELFYVENEKLEFEKKIVNFQMKELDFKQLEMEYETLKLRMLNKEKQLEKLEEEKGEIKRQFINNLNLEKDKNKFLEAEIDTIIKLNKAQEEEIKRVKDERKRAEKKQLEIQAKYDEEIGKLLKFEETKPKYIDRNSEGLKCSRYFTNTSTGTSVCKKIITLKLPTTIEVQKLVYGIMLGVQVNSKEVVYYDRLQLYEKESTRIELENESLVLTYRRRKENYRVILDRFVVRIPEVVIQLFGRGDSVIVHEEDSLL